MLGQQVTSPSNLETTGYEPLLGHTCMRDGILVGVVGAAHGLRQHQEAPYVLLSLPSSARGFTDHGALDGHVL